MSNRTKKLVKRWDVLLALVHERGWRSGAEIGVMNGATYFHLLDNCPGLTMTGVDRWPVDEPYYGDISKIGEEVKLRAGGYGDRAIVLHGASTEMAQQVADGSLDFVFIDADHSTAAVLADIKAWAPKVRQGGAILGHDIDWPSVAEAVSQSFASYLIGPDDVWMVVR